MNAGAGVAKPLLALAAVPIGAAAALLIAAATLWYIRRPHDREYVMRPDPEDGVQPFDPWPTTFHPEGAWIGGRYYPQDDGGTMTLSWKNDGTFTATGGHAVTRTGWKEYRNGWGTE